MGAVFFYHLTRSSLEAALATLIERAIAKGWKVVVRTVDSARAEWLDMKLWLGPEEGFLPHGLASSRHSDMQPVLLTTGPAPEGADCLMMVDGVEVAAQECQFAQRVCIVFDGNDPSAVQRARSQWKDLTTAGLAAQYWSEESGRWEKKAEVGG